MKIAALSKNNNFLKKLENRYKKPILSLITNAGEVLEKHKDITHIFFDIEENEEESVSYGCWLFGNPFGTIEAVCVYNKYKDYYEKLPFHRYLKI